MTRRELALSAARELHARVSSTFWEAHGVVAGAVGRELSAAEVAAVEAACERLEDLVVRNVLSALRGETLPAAQAAAVAGARTVHPLAVPMSGAPAGRA